MKPSTSSLTRWLAIAALADAFDEVIAYIITGRPIHIRRAWERLRQPFDQ